MKLRKFITVAAAVAVALLVSSIIPKSIFAQAELPDLVISETHEVWVVTGGSYTVHYTVENIGTATAPAGHNTRLRIDGHTVEEKEVPVPIAPGETYNDTFNTTSIFSSDTDFVQVFADIDKDIEERDEWNNVGFNYLAWPPAPNLEVYMWEEWEVEGQSYKVHYYIRNPGNSIAAAGHDVSLEVDGVVIDTQEVPVALDLNERYDGNFTTVLPLTESLDRLKIYADANNEVIESVEEDNFYQNTLTWPPAPDRAVLHKWEDWEVKGQSFLVHYFVGNIGNDTANTSTFSMGIIGPHGGGGGAAPVGELAPGVCYHGIITHPCLPGEIYTITVCLRGENDSLEDNNCLENVWPGLLADFIAQPTVGVAPLTVEFTNQSAGEVTSWLWDFGNDGTSGEPNPFHTYDTAGVYTVSMTVTGSRGTDTETKADYITVYEQAAVDFNPNTLKLKSKGKWVTCYIELPDGYDIRDIDTATVMLNTTIPAEWGDVQDGVLMVKFDRAEVQSILSPGDEVEVAVSGELLDGTPFEGTDMIRVIE